MPNWNNVCNKEGEERKVHVNADTVNRIESILHSSRWRVPPEIEDILNWSSKLHNIYLIQFWIVILFINFPFNTRIKFGVKGKRNIHCFEHQSCLKPKQLLPHIMNLNLIYNKFIHITHLQNLRGKFVTDLCLSCIECDTKMNVSMSLSQSIIMTDWKQ